MSAVGARRDPGKADGAKEGPCKGWFFSCVHNWHSAAGSFKPRDPMSDDAVTAPRRITPDKSSCFYSPRKHRGDFVEFVNLNSETDAFDLTKVEEQWGGRSYRDRGTACEPDYEFTYLVGKRGGEVWTERTRSTLKRDGDWLVLLEDQLVYRIPPR